MPITIPLSLTKKCQLTKESRQEILQTIIAEAHQHPTWTLKLLATWVSAAYGIKVPTAYQWIDQARDLLASEGAVVPGAVPGFVPSPVLPGQDQL